jgi:lipopolysaccharide/colanic/teichoic acid biosynthesis glycosyltransferase
MLFFGSLAAFTLIELLFAFFIYIIRAVNSQGFVFESSPRKFRAAAKAASIDVKKPSESRMRHINEKAFVSVKGQHIKKSVVEDFGEDVLGYLERKVPLIGSATVLAVNERINILNIPSENAHTIVNLSLINNHRFVNKFFEAVNIRLDKNGYYCGCCVTKEMRKKDFLKRYTALLGWPLYCIDFLWNRVAPKLPAIKMFYFSVTKGRNRVMSRAEILGRLYSCGFEVTDESYVNQFLFFVARKKRKPHYDFAATYGPLVRLERVGKDGKIIGVYKMRTMHPYAEYLQPYIYNKNKLNECGKFKDDFRINALGRIMRKLWIDELPMLVNWLKGEMKLIGVRPISRHYFELYSPELQQKRIRTKPGLVPPFYADMPKTFEEIEASEINYLDAYEKHPFLTDWRYFWKAFCNIVFRNARSS